MSHIFSVKEFKPYQRKHIAQVLVRCWYESHDRDDIKALINEMLTIGFTELEISEAILLRKMGNVE